MRALSTDERETLVNSGTTRDTALSILLLAVIVIAPLLILPGFSFYFDVTPKAVVLLLGAAAALLLWGNRLSPGSPRQLRWLYYLLIAQAASLLLSSLLSADPALSFTGTNWRRYGFLVQFALLTFVWMLALHLAAEPVKRVRLVLRAMAISGSLAAMYGIAQYFGWDPWLPAQAYHIGEGVRTIVRPPGTLGHADYFATYLLGVVFSGAALAMAEREGRWKYVGAAALCLGCAAIVLSGTRAASLGLLAGGLFLATWFRPRISFRAMAAGALAAGALATFYFAPAGQKLRSRVRWSLEDPRGGARLLLWRDTLRMAVQHWAAGAGPSTFTSSFPRFRSEELSRAYPDFFHESPHNIFLDALAAQGVLGLVVTIALCVFAFRAAKRARATQRQMAGVLAAMLFASLVSLQFSSFILPTALYFYVTITMLAVLTPADGAPAVPRARFERLAWVAAVVLAALWAVFAIRVWVADRALAAVKAHLEAGRLPEAMAEYRRVQRWQPAGMNADLWYSRSLAALAQKSPQILVRVQAAQVALEAAVRAARQSEDRPNAWYNLAALYATRNDFLRTEQSLRAAIDWSPHWYKPHWMLAQVLRAAGRVDEAGAEATFAVKLDGGKHEEVTRTWKELQQ